MKLTDFEIGKRAFKIIQKVSKDEFKLIATAPTAEKARVKLEQIDAERNGCFFIQYPRWAIKREPSLVVNKRMRSKRATHTWRKTISEYRSKGV